MTDRPRLSDRAIAAMLAVGVVVLVLLMGGWNDVPMNDDFSYGRTTEALATQGKIVYNGWGTPLMLPQMAIGALLVRILGFSWATLHLVGFAAAAASVAVVYLLARACRLGQGTSLTIGAVMALSPHFLGTVPTYLTDLPGMALGLGGMLLLVRSLRDDGGIDARRFVAAGIVGILAGANRQALWLPFLGALGVTALFVPSSRRLSAGFAAATLLVAVPLTRWFGALPYTVPVRFDMGMQIILAFPPVAFRAIYKFLNLTGLFVLPFGLVALRGRKVRWLLMGALCFFALLPVLHPMGTKGMPLLGDRYMLTYYGQYFTSAGIVVGGVDGFSRRPAVLPPWMVTVLVTLGAAGVAVGGYLFLEWWEGVAGRRRERLEARAVALTALTVYAAVQVIAFLPWLAQMNMFDRYLLPILPCLLIVHAAQGERAPRTWRAIPAVFAALLGLYGIASGIEYFGLTRARQTLVRRLEARGVTPTQIDAGFEFSADTQVTRGGHTNNPAIARPDGAYDPEARGQYLAYLPEMFPVFDARYRLSTSPTPGEVEEPPMETVSWFSPLPPFTRTMGVYKIVRPD